MDQACFGGSSSRRSTIYNTGINMGCVTMTPSEYIKAQGLPSLAYVAREAGIIERTLFNWYHNKNKLFEVVVAGVPMPCVKDEE